MKSSLSHQDISSIKIVYISVHAFYNFNLLETTVSIGDLKKEEKKLRNKDTILNWEYDQTLAISLAK
jgi:hypothetical protein